MTDAVRALEFDGDHLREDVRLAVADHVAPLNDVVAA